MTKPQDKELETPVYGRYIKVIAQGSTPTPVCFALELFGVGGSPDFAALDKCTK